MTASTAQSPATSPGSHMPQLPPLTTTFGGRSPGWPTATHWGGATGTAGSKRNTSGTASGTAETINREGWAQPRAPSAGWAEDSSVHKGSLYSGARQAASGKAVPYNPPLLIDSQPRRSSQPVNRGNGAMPAIRSASGNTLSAASGPQSISGNDLVNSFRAMSVQEVKAQLAPIQYPTILSVQPGQTGTPRTGYSEFPPSPQGHAFPIPHPYSHQYARPDPSLYASPALSAMATPSMLPPTPQMFSPIVSHRPPPGQYYEMLHSPGPPAFPAGYHFGPAPPITPIAMYAPHPGPPSMGMPMPMHGPYGQPQRMPQQQIGHRPTGSFSSPLGSPIMHHPPNGFHESQLRTGSLSRTPTKQTGSRPSTQLQSARGHGARQTHPDGILRSQLLEDFRNNKGRRWELRDIFGAVVEFSGDQHGSRFIQQKIETAEPDELQRVFDEIVPDHALVLMSDVFGNYVIQKLIEFGTDAHRDFLIQIMNGHIQNLSLNMYGCRVVQRAVEHITLEQQSDMVRELEANDIMICVNNSHGNHVVQKFLECVPADRLSFVKSFRGKVLELGQHPYGCRVLQRCFEHLPEDRSRPLLDELHLHSNVLMQDQYGNYVIQFVIEHGKPADCGRVIDLLHGQLLAMASHKFASNVCEKALLHASRENREGLINEMLALRSDGNTAIPLMVKDQYANYVLQRAMRVAEGDMSERLFAELLFVVPNLRKFAGASPKHLNAIQRILDLHQAGTQLDSHTPPTV